MNFRRHWLFTFALKVILAARLPLLGDEAYYVYWGKHPAGGYYDLPPMAGWWSTLLLTVSQNPVWLRLPAILLSSVLAWGVRGWLKGLRGPESVEAIEADRVGIFLLWIPFLLVPVILTTDTPLIAFWVLALLTFDRAMRPDADQQRALPFFLSGVWVGLAFLSKYFALLLGPIFLLAAMGSPPKNKPSLLKLGWVFLGVLPAVAQHLEWNSRNCWINLVFNLQTRHPGALQGTFKDFLIFCVILSLPAIPLLLSRYRTLLISALRAPENRIWTTSFFFPIFAFAVSAWNSGTGFHWLLGPFFSLYVVVARVVARVSLIEKRFPTLKVHQTVSLLVVTGIAAISYLPDSFFRARVSGAHYQDYVVFRYPGDVLQALESERTATDPLLTDSYSVSAVLEAAQSGNDGHFGVWGAGSKFGRVFDFTFSPKAWAGRDLGLLFRSEQEPSRFAPYFESTSSQRFVVRDAGFFWFKGKGFRAEAYVNEILKSTIANFYPMFRWPERGCPVRARGSL